MNKVIPMPLSVKQDASWRQLGSGRERPAHSREDPADQSCGVLFVNFQDKQLRLLRNRSRELDTQKFVMYKGITTVQFQSARKLVEARVRVLVRRRMVDYYYYCPICGRKVEDFLGNSLDESADYSGVPWPSIDEAVAADVRDKLSRHPHEKCPLGTPNP